MSDRILFGVPRVPAGMVHREGLLARIGSAPLTVLRGPGGSGKTVLMSQWAALAAPSGAWITVEPELGDRTAFWAAVADALSPGGLELRLPSAEGGRSDGGELRTRLVAAFRERTEPLALVVDDAHELRDPAVLDDILEILRAAPALTVVVGTRTRGELEAPRQALTLDIAVIGPGDLSLTAEEVARLVGDGGSPSGSVAELLDASGGNPLLLRAILAGASPTDARGAASAIVSDLLDGVFARAGAELASFASATAVPDDIDQALAAQMSGAEPDRVARMFAVLEADGLLMRREAADGPRFRYHPMVRDVLRATLRRGQPDRYRRLSLLASAAAERHGAYLTALRHAVDAEDYSRASDICLHGGMTLLRSRGAAAILQRVPLRYVARLPFIAIVLGLAANARGERFRALELMTLALGASRASRGRQRPAERIGLALIESVVLRATGRAADAVAPARRMLQLVDRADPADLEEIADQLDGFRGQAAVGLFRGGVLSEARVAAERAGASPEALREGEATALGAASLIAAVQAILGEVEGAAATLRLIEAGDFSGQLRGAYLGALSVLARGIVALEAGDPAAAQESADFAHGRDNLEYGALFSALDALTALWRGEPQTGLGILEQREGADRPRARMSHDDRRAVTASRVLLHAALGRLGAAHEALRMLARTDPIAAVLEAHVLLLERRPDLVAERLARASSLPGPRLQAAADLLHAAAAELAGDPGVAEQAMRDFLAAGDVHGVVSPFVLIPVEQREPLLGVASRVGAAAPVLERLRELPAPFVAGGTRAVLTPREAQVLAELRGDASLSAIARSLSVSTNTVKSQVRSLYRKLGASTREEALRAAYLQGLSDAAPQSREPSKRGW